MKKVILILSLLISTQVYSQKQSKTLEYEIIADNPDYNFIGLGGKLLELGMSGHELSLGTGLNAYGQLGKLFVNADYGLHWSLSSNVEGVIPIYGRTNPRFLNSTVAYVIKSSSYTKDDIEVELGRSSEARYYTVVSGTAANKISIDFGFNKYLSNFTMDGSDVRGSALPEGREEGLSEFENITTVYEASVLKFGGSITKQWFVKGKFEGYGDRYGYGFRRMYAHLLLGTTMTMDNVFIELTEYDPQNGQDVGTGQYFEYDLSPTGFSKLGLAVGYQMFYPMKFGMFGTIEAGVMPGPKSSIGDRSYLRFGAGFSFSELFNY